MTERGYVRTTDIPRGREGRLSIRKVEDGTIFNIAHYVTKGKVLLTTLPPTLTNQIS